MNQRFQEIVDECQRLMSELLAMPSRPWGQFSGLPKSGIYVFNEAETPVYVGRSNRLKGRLAEHGRPSSGHTAAVT